MSEYNFQKLTPKDDVELSIYEDALEFVFKNKDIKNIAVSGAYGAGKSSILETYKNKKNDMKFLHISLTHFESADEKDHLSEKVRENILEGKILNQLIHQINIEKIPQTTFKVKRNRDSKKSLKSMLLIVIVMLSVILVHSFPSWKIFVDSMSIDWLKSILSVTTLAEFHLFTGIVLIVSVGFAIYIIIEILKNKNIIKKISVRGNEIEIFQDSDNSYFDKYLNEVLYLFKNTDVDAIVFEDMDRYNANQIFQRLREVSNLVNQSRKENRKPLRFFYLLRDDIFSSKDRTKFFDYIIPIVPVIDSSNSYDKFIQHLKEGGIFELFEQSFLQDVSLYVDDMRLLKNIYNEFIIYNNQINTTGQDYNKLFSLIIYKNIFPSDFCDLQLNKGFVYTIFIKKEEFVEQEIKEIDYEIESLRSKIELADKEHLRNNQEVDKIYNHILQQCLHPDKKRSIEAEVEDRKEAVQNKAEDIRTSLKNKIGSLEKNKQEIQSKKLSQIINRNNIDKVFQITHTNEVGDEFDFNEIKGSHYFDLIKYLIRNGYIDETYPDYMTYFYENSLARIDKTFLRSVSDKRKKEYTYELKNPQMVIDRLSNASFADEEVLNFDLFSTLLSSSKNKSQRGLFIEQLRETRNLKFLKDFMETEKHQEHQEQFVKIMNLQWDDFFSIMLKEGEFLDEYVKVYSIITSYVSDIKNIKEVNVDGCLTDYISNNVSYLNIAKPNVNELITMFESIGVCFTSIDRQTANKDLLSSVYEKHLYQINFLNIILMLKIFYELEETKNFHHKNYTLISSSPTTALAQYIEENINEYIGIILENCENSICDDELAVLDILNNDKITLENKLAYIKVLVTKVESLKEVDNAETWRLLVERTLVTYSEDNILEYFFNSGSGLDETLVGFINRGEKSLEFSDLSNNYGKKASSNFFKAIIIANDLNNDKYKDIINSLRMYYTSYVPAGVSNGKMNILIDTNTVRMSKESLVFFRKNYTSNLLHFIEKNINSYIDEIMSAEVFEFEEMIRVISLDISDEKKIGLIGFTEEGISIVNSNYSDVVKKYILQNNLEVDDIGHLVISYLQESDSIKSMIELLAVDYKQMITDASITLSLELFDALLTSSKLQNIDKIEYFSFIIKTLDKEKTIKYLNRLGLIDYVKLFERGRPIFKINDVNKRLLNVFKANGWITTYEVDKKDAQYYRAFGRKMQKKLPTDIL